MAEGMLKAPRTLVKTHTQTAECSKIKQPHLREAKIRLVHSCLVHHPSDRESVSRNVKAVLAARERIQNRVLNAIFFGPF